MQHGIRTTLSMLIGLLICLPLAALATHHYARSNDVPFISVAGLLPEARTALHLIKQGGPFPYARDGMVFGNREQKLPQQRQGYYHEYTVRTPGARDRGARRIVRGPVPEGSPTKGSERDEMQGARSETTETYQDGRRESGHRATQQFARVATLVGLPECYYTGDHYRTFSYIRG